MIFLFAFVLILGLFWFFGFSLGGFGGVFLGGSCWFVVLGLFFYFFLLYKLSSKKAKLETSTGFKRENCSLSRKEGNTCHLSGLIFFKCLRNI